MDEAVMARGAGDARSLRERVRRHWPMGLGVVTLLLFLHLVLVAGMVADVDVRVRRGAKGGIRIEEGTSRGDPALPSSDARTGSTSKSLDDLDAASMVESLRLAAASGQTGMVDVLVPRLRSMGNGARQRASTALSHESRPEVKAALTRVLE